MGASDTGIFIAVFVLFTSACTHHDTRLEFPESDAVAGMYECSPTTGPENCQPSRTVDGSAQNRAGTAFVMMPAGCKKHFHRIVIHDADSSSPTVHVECAPSEGTIPPLTPITASPAPAATGAPSTPARP